MAERTALEIETIEKAKEYVSLLESGNAEEADNVLAELTNLRESQLFNELGRLTRDFHDTLNSFNSDDRFSKLANSEIPDARERLTYVITKTDDAAHKTMTAVEAAIPICDSLEKTLTDLDTAWNKFLSREMKPAEFRSLTNTMKVFFESSSGDLNGVKSNLNEILLAQDFQDITGQIIKRVITLVSEVENNLVDLIKLGSGLPVANDPVMNKSDAKEEKNEAGKLEGPQIPGMESDGIVNGQDDVDELLSSLGF